MNERRSTQVAFSPVRPTPEEVETFRSLIRQLTGLDFNDWRLQTLERALVARMSATGIQRTAHYLGLLQDPSRHAEELGALLDQITVNETYFFRYPAQFDFLRETVLPDLAQRRRRQRAPLRIWSAGCSTGEEPYSIAMTALDVFGPAAPQLVQIYATDVSTAALEAARRGEYSAKSVRLVNGANRLSYFRRIDTDRFAVSDTVRRMVLFCKSSLLDDACQAADTWDVIFCRNVLIYFAAESMARIIEGLYRRLTVNGYLFVGHSEILKQTDFVPCQPEDVFAYRKLAETPESTSPAGQTHAPRLTPKVAARDLAAGSEPPPTTRSAPNVSDSGRAAAAQVLYEQARVCFDREDYAGAHQHLDRLLESCPRHLAATVLRANVYLNLGEHSRSVEECEMALQLDPFASEAYLLLGMNFQKLAKNELAILQLKKAAYISPDWAVVQFWLGEAYRALQKWDEAARAYRNALRLFPSTPDRDIRIYSGGFGKSALATLCEQMLTACRR